MPKKPASESRLPTDQELIELIRKSRKLVQFIRAINSALGTPSNYTDEISMANARLHETAGYYLWMVMAELSDERLWESIAESPRLFGNELEATLERIRACMRALYGIEQNRPTRNAIRDAKIWHLKHERRLSLRQIATRLKMRSSAAGRACERHDERMREALDSLTDIISFVERWSIPIYMAAKEMTPKTALPPAPGIDVEE